jgi:selenocysteine lyase/cysteine desulfurase
MQAELEVTTSPRALFDIPEDVTYLNCANMAPQLRSITEAGLAAVRARAAPWMLPAKDWFFPAETLRNLAAQVLGTDSDAVALVPAVSYGIATAAANLPVAPGQSIVVLDQEFPSNVYAWRALAKRTGARIETIRRETGEEWTDALLRSIGEDTAIVAVPQCHWTDGSRVDLEAVGKRCRSVGAGFVIDASQSLGACPLNLETVQPDFVAAVGYKWLLGPYSLAYLYVAPKWRATGIPLEHSWLTRARSDDFARLVEYTDDYRPGARRFDMGEFLQFVLAPMAIAALQQVLCWGVESIEKSLSILTNHVAERAASAGYLVLPREQRCSHMIGFRFPGGIPAGLSTALELAKVFVSLRGDAVRVAPHLYNDIRDIDRLFEVLHSLPTR